MIFNLDVSGLGSWVSGYLTSFAPWFYLVGGLVVAAGIVSWGISLLGSWQEDDREGDPDPDLPYVREDGAFRAIFGGRSVYVKRSDDGTWDWADDDNPGYHDNPNPAWRNADDD